jgi:hypothetical protein
MLDEKAFAVSKKKKGTVFASKKEFMDKKIYLSTQKCFTPISVAS